MHFFNEIFEQYSLYTGTGIFMVLFFVALVYLYLTERDDGNRAVLLFGSIFTVILILFPPFYYLYTYYDAGTYWRMWWLVPTGIGLAYVGTKLIYEYRLTGCLLTLLIFTLGGGLIYSRDNPVMKKGETPLIQVAENNYKLPQYVIDVCNLLEADTDGYICAAFPPEFLPYVRQYDVNIMMPYGREQFDSTHLDKPSGFFEEMNRATVLHEPYDFTVIRKKCIDNHTNYLIVNNLVEYANNPSDSGYEYYTTYGVYEIYRFTEGNY